MTTSQTRSILPYPHAILAGLGTAVAVIAGYQSVGESPRDALMIAAAVFGAVLLFLAYTRFEVFLLVTLAIRASVDWTNTPSASGQPTTSGALTTALALTFLCAAMMWLLVQHQAGRLLPPAPLSIAWLAFLGVGLMSALAADQRLVSLSEVGRIATAVLMLFVLQQVLREERQVRRLLVVCYMAALVPLVVATGQAVTGSSVSVSQGISRVHGTFLHPNAFGFYLTILIVMGVALLPHLEEGWRRLLLPLLWWSGALLVVSYSRGSWVAVVAGLIVLGILQSRRLLLGLLALIAVVIISVPSVTARITDLSGPSTPGVSRSSLDWRFDYWGTVIALANDSPLVGIGPKMTQYATDEAKVPHNDFLRAYVETGLLGLIAYMAFVMALLQTARRAVSTTASGMARGIGIGFAGCVAAFVVFSLAENLMSQVVVLWYFGAFAAAAIAVTRWSSPGDDSKRRRRSHPFNGFSPSRSPSIGR